MHNDHVGGLDTLIKVLRKYPREDNHCDIFLPEAAAIKGLEEWLKAQHCKLPLKMVSLKTAQPGRVYDDAQVSVEAQPTKHMRVPPGAPSLAYVFRTKDKVAVFTGDLIADFSDFPAAARDTPCDVCVCEATHFTPSDSLTQKAMDVLRKAPIKRLIMTHVGDRWHGLDGEYEFKTLLRELPYEAQIAYDGDVFCI